MTGIDNGQVTESELVIPTLQMLDASANGFMATSDLIVQLESLFSPIGKDAQIVPGRKDSYFSQKVRNLICHRDSNFVALGYAIYDEAQAGLTITNAGRAYLTPSGS